MSQYLLDHKTRLTNLTNDINTLIENSRIKDIPVHTTLVDRDPKNMDPNYQYMNQDPHYASAAGVNGYMLYTGNIVSNNDFEVTDLYVKATMYSPKTLVHEYAHLVDFAHGEGEINQPDGSNVCRSHNDPLFKPIISAYKDELINIYKQAGPNISDDKILNYVNHHPTNKYYMKPTEIHSRLFEVFYSTEIEPYRNLTDYNRGDIYSHTNQKYGHSTAGNIAASQLYHNNEHLFVADYFKSNYNAILPKNHPEYEKYTGNQLSNQERESAQKDQQILFTTKLNGFYEQLGLYESKTDTNNTNSLSDAELLEKLEQVTNECITTTETKTPSFDIDY